MYTQAYVFVPVLVWWLSFSWFKSPFNFSLENQALLVRWIIILLSGIECTLIFSNVGDILSLKGINFITQMQICLTRRLFRVTAHKDQTSVLP